MSDQDRLNRTTGEGDEGTNQVNHIIRGEIRWPEMRESSSCGKLGVEKTKSLLKR